MGSLLLEKHFFSCTTLSSQLLFYWPLTNNYKFVCILFLNRRTGPREGEIQIDCRRDGYHFRRIGWLLKTISSSTTTTTTTRRRDFEKENKIKTTTEKGNTRDFFINYIISRTHLSSFLWWCVVPSSLNYIYLLLSLSLITHNNNQPYTQTHTYTHTQQQNEKSIGPWCIFLPPISSVIS